MTDLATLAIQIDSTGVKSGAQELDKLTAAGGKAEKGAQDLAQAWGKADVSMTALGRATAEAKSEMTGYAAALKSGSITQAEYEANILKTRAALSGFQADHRSALAEYERARRGLDGVTVSAGAQRAGMQQLGMQIGDAATMFSMGANASQVFASQLGQATGAVELMLGSTSRLGAFLSGTWGRVITTAAIVLVPFIAKLFESGDAADKAADSYKSAADQARNLIGAQNALALNQKRMDLNKATERQFELENLLATGERIGSQRTTLRAKGSGFFTPYRQVSDIEAELRATRLQAAEAKNLIGIAERETAAAEAAAAAKAKHTGATTRHAGSTRGASTAMSEAQRHAEALAKSEDALALAALRTAYAFDQKMQSIGAASLAGGIIGEFKPEQMTAMERLARDNAAELEKIGAYFDDWNSSLDGTIDRLSRIGGIGGDIAGWAKALTRGDFSALPGATGVALQSILATPAGTMFDKASKSDVSVTLGNRIESIFKKDGAFGDTMKALLQGAGTGVAFSTLAFGQSGNNLGAALGGGIGGAFSKGFGESVTKVMGKTLGKIAEGVLPVIGGLLGGLLGSVLGKKPRGSGSVSNMSVTSSANDGGIKASLDSFGLGLQQSVGKIADTLGGTVGTYNVGIGRYKDAYQVAKVAGAAGLGGSYYQKNHPDTAVYDGVDGSAALRAAISVAIEQGAIQGVRAGTQTLLKAGTDIEAQLAKAMKFQGAFDDLKQATDPIGYALDQITKKFDDLRKVFGEAGATAEEYANLEQLLALQRQDALDKARQDVVSKVNDPISMAIQVLDLLGQSEKSVTAQRLLELAGLKDTLQPLQGMIYTLTDAKAVIDKFTPLRDDLIKFRDELLGGDTAGSFGFLTAKFRATAMAAANGDATAMGSLRGTASDYLSAAKDNAGSLQEYNRAKAEVLAGVNGGIFAADSQIDYQQAVIDTAKSSERMAGIMADLQANLASLSGQLLTTQADVARIIRRWDGGDNGAPFQVEVVAV